MLFLRRINLYTAEAYATGRCTRNVRISVCCWLVEKKLLSRKNPHHRHYISHVEIIRGA